MELVAGAGSAGARGTGAGYTEVQVLELDYSLMDLRGLEGLAHQGAVCHQDQPLSP